MDDLILLTTANQKSCNLIIDTLNKFCNFSAQSINFSKSRIFFSNNTPTDIRDNMSHCLAMKSANEFGKYLGFPMMSYRPSKKDFQFIIDRLNNRLKGWKINHLTLAGRSTLIKSTLAAISNHVMQIYNLPQSTLKNIDTIQRNFLWGSTSRKKKCHLSRWDIVVKSKKEGGLGLCKSKWKNYSL